MKTLLIALGLLTFAVACNNNSTLDRQEEVHEARKEFEKEKVDAKEDYDKQLQEANEERIEKMNEAKHDAIDAREEEIVR